MGLDVRIPVGLLFSAIGLALLLYGLFGDAAVYAKSLGVNVNAWWGFALLVFGGVMLALGLPSRAGRASPGADADAR